MYHRIKKIVKQINEIIDVHIKEIIKSWVVDELSSHVANKVAKAAAGVIKLNQIAKKKIKIVNEVNRFLYEYSNGEYFTRSFKLWHINFLVSFKKEYWNINKKNGIIKARIAINGYINMNNTFQLHLF
ncbi:MAG: hypothetical protein ACRCVI_00005 [Mycoplasmoidaceae bacterium]